LFKRAESHLVQTIWINAMNLTRTHQPSFLVARIL